MGIQLDLGEEGPLRLHRLAQARQRHAADEEQTAKQIAFAAAARDLLLQRPGEVEDLPQPTAGEQQLRPGDLGVDPGTARRFGLLEVSLGGLEITSAKSDLCQEIERAFVGPGGDLCMMPGLVEPVQLQEGAGDRVGEARRAPGELEGLQVGAECLVDPTLPHQTVTQELPRLGQLWLALEHRAESRLGRHEVATAELLEGPSKDANHP